MRGRSRGSVFWPSISCTMSMPSTTCRHLQLEMSEVVPTVKAAKYRVEHIDRHWQVCQAGRSRLCGLAASAHSETVLTSPNTTCLPSSHGVLTVQMKNCACSGCVCQHPDRGGRDGSKVSDGTAHLRPVGIGTSIRHRHSARARVLQLEVLILECAAWSRTSMNIQLGT